MYPMLSSSLKRKLGCFFLLVSTSLFPLLLANTTTDQTKPAAVVSYTRRSFHIHGKPLLLLSGSIHYHRVPPSDWNNVFLLAKELGLNAIQTYVIWSAHEPVRGGELQWEGYADLIRFIELAAANDLYVVLRIGPYICGEYYFGGIPLWMRHVTAAAADDDDEGERRGEKNQERKIECFRCSDPLWEKEMKRWVSIVVDKVRAQLVSNGGPIIWMQIENEYEPDDDYLEWAVDMARNITTEVPWSLCGHAIDQCNQLNGFGGAHKKEKDMAICTINGFWVDQSKRGDQPSPTFFHKLWPDNPIQPAAWTEDQGWFDVWGMGRRIRSTSDQLYGIARFLAYGGSYHNFYMLTGGNNYERRAGRDATTAYAADTAIDNLLLRHQPRFSTLRDFFRVIRSVEEDLLNVDVPIKPIPLNPTSSPSSSSLKLGSLGDDSTPSSAEVHKYGYLAFLSNFGEGAKSSNYFDFGGHSYFLPNHTVILLDTLSNKVLFNTSTAAKVEQDHNKQHLGAPSRSTERKQQRNPIGRWLFFQEKVGYGAKTNPPQTSPEQLNITDNKSDYMWYSFNTSNAGKISVNAIGEGGLQYIYVEGVLSDSTTMEDSDEDYNNASIVVADRSLQESVQLDKRKNVAPNAQRRKSLVDILSVAMGMSTTVHPETGKGIKNVTIGKDNPPQTTFATAWTLKGEEMEIYTKEGSKRVEWQPMLSPLLHSNDGLLWFQGHFDLPNWLHPFVGQAQPNQTALVVNLGGLNKGVAYVNGFNIGRYWLLAGQCDDGDCAPPNHGPHCYLHWTNCGKPTQDLYHVPFEVLEPFGNVVTLFEEAPSSSKQRNLHDVFMEIIHDHRT